MKYVYRLMNQMRTMKILMMNKKLIIKNPIHIFNTIEYLFNYSMATFSDSELKEQSNDIFKKYINRMSVFREVHTHETSNQEVKFTDYEKFLDLYTDFIHCDNRIQLREFHGEVTPFWFNINFRQLRSIRYYTKSTIESIIEISNTVITTYLNVDAHNLTSYVLQYSTPTTALHSDKLRVFYPGIILKPHVIEFLKIQIVTICMAKHVFDDVPFVNSVNSLLSSDNQILTSMFGSTEPANDQVMRLAYIFNGIDSGSSEIDHDALIRERSV